MSLSPEMNNECMAITLTSAIGIVNTFMEKQEKVTHCEVPGCNKKLFGNTYMCCRPMENITDMSHKGHTCCEECATTENYIEKNRCKVCLAVATGRRSGTKGAGYPLQPPQLNTLATNMLEVLRETEESVVKAREEADAVRRADGPNRRAEALEEVHDRKRKRQEEALRIAEDEAKRAKIAEEEAHKKAAAAEEMVRKQAMEAEQKQKSRDKALRVAEDMVKKQVMEAEQAQKRKDKALKEAEEEAKRAKRAEEEAKKKITEAEVNAKKREDAAVAAAEAKAKEREAIAVAAAKANVMETPTEDSVRLPKKPSVSEEVRKERAQRAKSYRDKKKEEDKALLEKANSADMFQWQVERAIAMAKDTITSLGGDAGLWEARVIEAFDFYDEEEEEEEVPVSMPVVAD